MTHTGCTHACMQEERRHRPSGLNTVELLKVRTASLCKPRTQTSGRSLFYT